MSIENTSNVFPEGEFIMQVSDVPNKSERKGFVFWNFNFSTLMDGEFATYEESTPIWLCAPIFRVLGYPEVRPGSFDVDPTKAMGKRIKCKIVHEDVKGTIRARMKDMVLIADNAAAPVAKSGIPF